MRALRPQLSGEGEFARYVDEVLRPEGYRLVGVFDEGVEQARAVGGFRAGHSLAWEHYLYLDDLSTVETARRRGHARLVLDWLVDETRRLGCDQLHLDSAVAPQRADAHRLYLNAGYAINALHFARRV